MNDGANNESWQGPAIESGSTIAVTGASGFIGGRLVECLSEQGAVATCLVRESRTSNRLQKTGATIRTLDLTERGPLIEALTGIEIVFHCAYDWENEGWNYRSLRALIEACRANGCRLVHLSSFVVYEIPADGELTEESPAGMSAAGYAHTKRALEGELLRAAREDEFPVTILQPTIVYGPFCRPWTIDPAEKLQRGNVVLPDSGEGVCNAVYVDDVVSAMILAARAPQARGERFLISGSPITWAEYYEALAREVGTNGPLYLPAKTIVRRGTKVRRLLRVVADPKRLIRRVAQTRAVRRLVETALAALPRSIRERAMTRLFESASVRASLDLPDRGTLRWLQSRATVRSKKARRVLNYVPRFDFGAGMVLTGRYLRECVQKF